MDEKSASVVVSFLSFVRDWLDERRTRKTNKKIEADLEWVEDGSFYIRKSEKAKGQSIGYCPACWHDNGKLVALINSEEPGTLRCVIHEATHYTGAHAEWKKKTHISPACVGIDPPERRSFFRRDMLF